MRSLYNAYYGEEGLKNPTTEEWAAFAASCNLRDMGTHLCALPTGEHCPKGLICLGCAHAQPKKSALFVWGRNHTRTSIVDGRARKTRGHARPLEQWEVTIPNHHEGYIAWEEFMRNQQQIRANAGWNARMGSTNGAVRNGPALLAGLLRCGRCGRALQVAYARSKQHGLLPRYWCAGDRGQQMVRSGITFAGTREAQTQPE